mmetsp:Transcript_100311/g.259413  ORF Transcript_100311/g.259413 Transcript_100311/m.259413 type:complete len:242 (+) Transcript_100311:966-1691(+)
MCALRGETSSMQSSSPSKPVPLTRSWLPVRLHMMRACSTTTSKPSISPLPVPCTAGVSKLSSLLLLPPDPLHASNSTATGADNLAVLTIARSPWRDSLACCTANPFCRTASSTTRRSSRRASDAYASAMPSPRTEARTTSTSPRKGSDANCKARPQICTAFRTNSRLPRKASEAYCNARPSSECSTAVSTISGSLLNVSGTRDNSKPSCCTILRTRPRLKELQPTPRQPSLASKYRIRSPA